MLIPGDDECDKTDKNLGDKDVCLHEITRTTI